MNFKVFPNITKDSNDGKRFWTSRIEAVLLAGWIVKPVQCTGLFKAEGNG
jgi:hypothetical protein